MPQPIIAKHLEPPSLASKTAGPDLQLAGSTVHEWFSTLLASFWSCVGPIRDVLLILLYSVAFGGLSVVHLYATVCCNGLVKVRKFGGFPLGAKVTPSMKKTSCSQ